MNPEMLVQSWSKLLPDLEDDLQGFLNEEISKSEILDILCAMRSYKNVDEWLQSDACDVGFQRKTHVSAAVKQKGENEGGADES
jgi:uncharacterized protein YeeX (DUF496 family)